MSWKTAALHDEGPHDEGPHDEVPQQGDTKKGKKASWKRASLEPEVPDGVSESQMIDWKRGPLQADGNPSALKKHRPSKAWKKQSLLDETVVPDDSDEDAEVQQNEVVTVHLSLPLLRMLPPDEQPSTSYASNGMSADRIRHVLSTRSCCK